MGFYIYRIHRSLIKKNHFFNLGVVVTVFCVKQSVAKPVCSEDSREKTILIIRRGPLVPSLIPVLRPLQVFPSTLCRRGLASTSVAYRKRFAITIFTLVLRVDCAIVVYGMPLLCSSFTGSAAFPNGLEQTVNRYTVCVFILSSPGSLSVCSELCSRNIPHPTKTPTWHNICAVLNIKWQAALTVSAPKLTGNFR